MEEDSLNLYYRPRKKQLENVAVECKLTQRKHVEIDKISVGGSLLKCELFSCC